MPARARSSLSVTAAVVIGSFLVASGCKRQVPFAPPPPPEVVVAKPIVRTLPKTLEFTGNTRGVETVDVRARVRGFIDTKNIRGGEKVKAGDVLFRIDPRPFEAAVGQAQADVASAEARQRLAQITLERKQQSGTGVSKTELDQSIAERDAAKATYDLAQRRLDAAKLDLEFTNVRAPFDGRVDVTVNTGTGTRPIANVGELVGDATSAPLCTITNDSTIYVTFQVDEQTLLDTRKQYNYDRPGEGGRPPLIVYMGFENDRGRYPYVGQYDAGNAGISTSTGTSTVEAVFDNSEGHIITGAFARIKSVVGEETVTLVPDSAVSNDQIGRYVLVVGADNKVQRVGVDVGDTIGQMRKIYSGLTPDANVVVNGLQRARPGAPVKFTETTLPEPKLELGIPNATTLPTSRPSFGPTSHAATGPSTSPVKVE